MACDSFCRLTSCDSHQFTNEEEKHNIFAFIWIWMYRSTSSNFSFCTMSCWQSIPTELTVFIQRGLTLISVRLWWFVFKLSSICIKTPSSFHNTQTHVQQSGFSQTHKIANNGIVTNFVFPYLQFPSLFATNDVSKYNTGCQWLQQDYISQLQTSLLQFLSDGKLKRIW